MGNVASEIWIWEQDGRLHARLRTNATERAVRERLVELGLCELLESFERHTDVTHMRGGTHVMLRWREGVTAGDIREQLASV